ncbi:MAG: hypothetical protein QM802_18535 [Agriterribacter sp.]
MNIAIIRVFRRFTIIHTDCTEQLQKLKVKIGGHDAQLNQIYDALENLLDAKAAEKSWQERVRIGFNNNEES